MFFLKFLIKKMEINKIKLSEGCYGPDIEINGESLFLHEYDNRTEEDVREHKIALINELLKIVDNINIIDLKYIGEIIGSSSHSFEFIEEESSESTCDQCGNWNYTHVYKKIDE
jgi:hypothetical protein